MLSSPDKSDYELASTPRNPFSQSGRLKISNSLENNPAVCPVEDVGDLVDLQADGTDRFS